MWAWTTRLRRKTPGPDLAVEVQTLREQNAFLRGQLTGLGRPLPPEVPATPPVPPTPTPFRKLEASDIHRISREQRLAQQIQARADVARASRRTQPDPPIPSAP